MNWDFNRQESSFEAVSVGKHRVRIQSAEMAVSKNGNDMLVLKLDVSGTIATLFNYIVFLVDKPEITNKMLTQLFDSFGISDGDFDLTGYVGKVGGAKVRMDGEYARVHYFLNKKAQTDLPPWNEAKINQSKAWQDIELDEDLPF